MGKPSVCLGSPALVQADEARRRNEAKIEQVAIARPRHGPPNALEVPAVDMEERLELVAAGDTFLLLAGDTGRFFAPRLGHLEQVVHMPRVGGVAQVEAREGADLQIALSAC